MHLTILTIATVKVDEVTMAIRIKYMYLLEVLAVVVVYIIFRWVTLGVATAAAGTGWVLIVEEELLEMEVEPPLLVDALFLDVVSLLWLILLESLSLVLTSC